MINIIKTGQTFNVALEVFNSSENKGVELTDLVDIKAIIYDANDKKVQDVVIEFMDQNEYPGWIILNVDSEKTKLWPEGELFLTIRLEVAGMVMKTDSLKFFVEKDINE